MHSHHDHTEGAGSVSVLEDGSQPDMIAEARRVVAEDEQARMHACAEEISQVLAKHGMQLSVTPAQITIVPAE